MPSDGRVDPAPAEVVGPSGTPDVVPAARYATPSGEPCPRWLRVDGTVEGSGDCIGCGTCLQGSGLV